MRVAILGAGRIGSWLLRRLSAEGHHLAFLDPKVDRIGEVRKLASVSDLSGFHAEMLINAAPLHETVEVLEEALPFVPQDCLLCDVSSTKAKVSRFYQDRNRRFVSIHPMFGAYEADLDACRDQVVVLIAESDARGKEFFTRLFGKLGIKVLDLAFQDFDLLMSYSLTTPGVASLVFSACVDRSWIPAAVFNRHMEIAQHLLSQDDRFLAEILFNPGSLAQLDKMTAKLEFIKHIIRSGDFGEIQKIFQKLRANLRHKPLVS